MNLKKLGLVILSLIAIAVLSAIVFHKSILNEYVNSELEKKGLPITLEIESLGTGHLNLKNIRVGQGSLIEHLKIKFDLKTNFNLREVDIKVAEYNIDELKSIQPHAQAKSSALDTFKFEHCKKIEKTKFFVEVAGFHSIEVSLSCKDDQLLTQIQNIHYHNIGPLHVELQTAINRDPLSSLFNIRLENELIANGKLDYSIKNKKFNAQIDQLKDSLQVKNLIEKLAPKEIKEQILNSSGTLNFSGKLVSAANQLGLDFDLMADDINIETEAYRAKGVYVRHSVVEYPSLKSKPRQSFKAKEVTVGTTIHDLKVVYDVESQEKVNVNQFKMRFEGVEVSAKNFIVYPMKKRSGPTRIDVDKLSLQKFLKLALGDTATATGELIGDVQIRFKNNKPIIQNGTLKAKGPGTIQYRPPTSKGPPDPNSFSTDPIEILNNYLYDFHYSDLSVTMSSDESFDMKMTLTALGKNPGYLSGKSLKLNVNLEQNLLAAFQAMMLSYNLPKRLEEKITNLGK